MFMLLGVQQDRAPLDQWNRPVRPVPGPIWQVYDRQGVPAPLGTRRVSAAWPAGSLSRPDPASIAMVGPPFMAPVVSEGGDDRAVEVMLSAQAWRYRAMAMGRQTAMSAADQMSAGARSWLAAVSTERTALTIGVTGWCSAKGWSQPGMEEGDT
jgi:hypothetical protein